MENHSEARRPGPRPALALLAVAGVLASAATWMALRHDGGGRAPLALGAGAATCLLLGAFALLLVRTWARAEERARRLTRELREKEQRLSLVLRGTNDGSWDWDIPSGRVVYDQRWAEMLGYRLEELEPHVRTWERLVHPEDEARARAALQAHLRGETPFYECEHRLRTQTGEWKWILDRGLVVERDAAGKPLRAAGTHGDVTEKRAAAEALRESEARHRHLAEELERSERRYRALFENLRESATVYDLERGPDGRVTDWVMREANARARADLGERYPGVLGRRLTELFDSEAMRRLVGRTEELLAGGQESSETFFPLTGRYYLTAVYPLGAETVALTALDTTDRRLAEERTRQALLTNEKLVGELREALQSVRTLSGLLPICVYCKKIRDDKGYWERIEAYLSAHTDALFTHGLCPDCLRRHFP